LNVKCEFLVRIRNFFVKWKLYPCIMHGVHTSNLSNSETSILENMKLRCWKPS
jgi:hypothetical protein